MRRPISSSRPTNGPRRGEGRCLPFLLEYDRGTLDRSAFASKLGGYRAYFAEEAWRRDFEFSPVVLFVCTDDQAEDRVAVAAHAGASGVPLLITSEWRFERSPGNRAGLLGPVWRKPASRATQSRSSHRPESDPRARPKDPPSRAASATIRLVSGVSRKVRQASRTGILDRHRPIRVRAVAALQAARALAPTARRRRR